ncbi:ribbon-helix-helix protein, CopG family [Tautonia sp. JC769]|uniref:CopG family ribbon-helix-helix protein n=1 Tax=Tautonia sp. JC769 TaxID=3232135 RepID=UPI0034592A2D
MREITLSTRINGELAEQVEHLATALGRSKSWLLQQALESYVTSERQFLDVIQEGIDAYHAGQVVDHADVVAEVHRRRHSRLS